MMTEFTHKINNVFITSKRFHKTHCIVMARIFAIFIFLSTLFGLSSCAGNNKRILSQADTLVFSKPDSALSLLNTIEPTSLTREQKAWLTLLRAKAFVKSGKAINADSTLSEMVAFYTNHGDSLEIQSLYYYGQALKNQNDKAKTLSAFIECYDLANLNGDDFYAGLSARNISRIYDEFFIGQEQIEWANKEKMHFIKSGSTLHASWADLDRIRASVHNGRPKEALEIIENIDSGLYSSNRDFRVLTNANKAIAMHSLKDYPAAVKTFYSQIENGIPLTSGQWNMLSDCYLNIGDFASAVMANDSARVLSTTRIDSIRVALTDATLAAHMGNYREAWEKQNNFTEALISEADAICNQPLLTTLNNTLREKFIVEKQLSRTLSQRNATLIVILVLVVSIIILTFFWGVTKRRLTKKNIEIKEIMTDTVCKEVKDMNNNISNILAPQLSLLDQLYLRLYNNSSIIKKKAAEKKFDEIICQIRSSQTFSEMEVWINENNDDWMKKFDSLYPDFSSSYRQLAILLFLGFSSSSIAFLTDRDSINAVHTAKSRLKSKISAIDDTQASQILMRLGLSKS